MKFKLICKERAVKVHVYYIDADSEADARDQALNMRQSGISHEMYADDVDDDWECISESKSVIERLVEEYGLSSPEDYYDYIVQSYVNGQKKQARMLFRAMTMPERQVCLQWIDTIEFLPEIETIKLKIFLCQTGA
jgi:hypothetical protein